MANATAAVIDDARQLASLLRDASIPAIAGVDTRALARHLRANGSLRAVVTEPGAIDRDAAVAPPGPCRAGRTRTSSAQVSPAGIREEGDPSEAGRSSRSSTSGSRRTSSGPCAGAAPGCGSCPTRSARKRRWPTGSTGSCSRPDPGDPARLDGPVALARAAIADGRPLLGICLGHQIVARAAGADTRRLRFGHHGANHPVRDVDRGVVQVTAQNHEVTVVGETLPGRGGFHVSQVNLNDGSVEGLRHRELPMETVQYHPEGAPGRWTRSRCSTGSWRRPPRPARAVGR